MRKTQLFFGVKQCKYIDNAATQHYHTYTYIGNEKMNQVILVASGWLNFNGVVSVYMKLVTAYCDLQSAMARKSNVRRTINELSKLSDRELNDMGISRGMIRSVAEGTNRA